jgi:preprotein translocase subunit SecD
LFYTATELRVYYFYWNAVDVWSIFERIKEELRNVRRLSLLLQNGFKNWVSFEIQTYHLSSLLLILYAFGTTLIKSFALVLLIGVVTSLVSAVVISRLLLYSFNFKRRSKFTEFMFWSGFTNAKQIVD